jgi:osmotically-inducible protein OsmY
MESTLAAPKFRTDAPHCRAAETERSLERPEARIRRELLAHDEWQFERLVVRQIPGGVCLEGVMLSQADFDEITSCVRQCAGIESVQHRLIVCQRSPKG